MTEDVLEEMIAVETAEVAEATVAGAAALAKVQAEAVVVVEAVMAADAVAVTVAGLVVVILVAMAAVVVVMATEAKVQIIVKVAAEVAVVLAVTVPNAHPTDSEKVAAEVVDSVKEEGFKLAKAVGKNFQTSATSS